MIKSSVVTPQTPSFLTGKRGQTHMVKLGNSVREPVAESEDDLAEKLAKKLKEDAQKHE